MNRNLDRRNRFDGNEEGEVVPLIKAALKKRRGRRRRRSGRRGRRSREEKEREEGEEEEEEVFEAKVILSKF